MMTRCPCDDGEPQFCLIHTSPVELRYLLVAPNPIFPKRSRFRDANWLHATTFGRWLTARRLRLRCHVCGRRAGYGGRCPNEAHNG